MFYAPNYDDILIAEREIYEEFGDRVSVALKSKPLVKFGRNANVGTSQAAVQQFQGSETEIVIPSTNAITHIVTDDATFTGQVFVEGHTRSGTNLTFSRQTITMAGQTPVALSPSLNVANRILFPLTGGGLAAGKKIYVYEGGAVTAGVPDDSTKTHVLLDSVYNQSQKTGSSISKDDYYLVTLFYGGVLKKQDATVDIRLELVGIDGTFRTIFETSATSQGSSNDDIDGPPVIIIPKNTHFRVVSSSSVAGTEVFAGLAGYLASIIS